VRHPVDLTSGSTAEHAAHAGTLADRYLHRRTRTAAMLRYWRYSPLALYIAPFLYATEITLCLVVLPWRVMALGGQQLAVGAINGLWFGVYVLALFLMGPRADRIGTKRLILLAAVLTIVSVVLMMTAASVAMLLIAVCLAGSLASMFWPPLIGWISTGYEGPRLQHRLGYFNLGWSSGSICGAWLGGLLMRISHEAPFVAAIACLIAMMLLVAGVRPRRTLTRQPPHAASHRHDSAVSRQAQRLKGYRLISRVALLAICLAMGATSSPLASFIDSLGLGETHYAWALAVRSLTIVCASLVLSRITIWHYNFGWLAAFQTLTAAAMIVLAASGTAPAIYACIVLTTLGYATVYFSHLFYGVSNSPSRSASMAVHEIVLSLGMVIGALVLGGFLGQYLGERLVYRLVAAALVAGVLIQTIIYLAARRHAAG